MATCGTALTDDHVRLLKRFTNRLVLAFDADDAGKAAADRVYAWEREYEIDVAVADLPAGVDPDDLARDDPERLKASIENAKPFLQFRLDRVLDTGAMDTAEQRARVAEAALALVREHPSELVRDQYVMDVADRCRIDADRLREMLRNPRQRGSAVPAAPALSVAPTASDNVEDQAIQLLISGNRTMRDLLSPGLFVAPMRQAVFIAVRDAPTVREAVDMLGADEADLLRRLAAAPDDELDAAAVASRVLGRAADRFARELEAEAKHTGELATLLPEVKFLRQWVIDLREPRSDLTELLPLADWVAMKSETEAA